MTAPEIRKLAEDYLALPPGPYYVEHEGGMSYLVTREKSDLGEGYYESQVFVEMECPHGFDQAEARRLNAMPGLLRAKVDWLDYAEERGSGTATREEITELAHLIARCEAHQRGEAHA